MTDRPNENIEVSREDEKQAMKKFLREVYAKQPENEGKEELELVKQLIGEVEKQIEDLEGSIKNIEKYRKQVLETIKEAVAEEHQKELSKDIKKKSKKELQEGLQTTIDFLNRSLELWNEILSEMEGSIAQAA